MDYLLIILLSFSLLLLFSIKTALLSKPKSKEENKKSLPPSGPPALPLIGHLYLFKKPLHRTLARIAAAHGPILLLRFGSRPVLVVSSATLAEECFSKNDVTFAHRPRFPSTKALSYNYTTLGSITYGPSWRNMRRIATVELLSTHRLLSSAAVRAGEVRAMVARLFRESGGGFLRVELRPRLFGLSLNVMMRMIAGKRYYGEEEGGGGEEAREFRAMVEETFSVFGASNVGDFMPALRLVDFQGVKKKVERLQAWRDKFLQRLIEEERLRRSRDESEKDKTMIGVLLSLQESDPECYTDTTIKALVIVPPVVPSTNHFLRENEGLVHFVWPKSNSLFSSKLIEKSLSLPCLLDSSLTINWGLTRAMVERWNPKTHTFNFHFGEMSVFIEEVSQLLSLFRPNHSNPSPNSQILYLSEIATWHSILKEFGIKNRASEVVCEDKLNLWSLYSYWRGEALYAAPTSDHCFNIAATLLCGFVLFPNGQCLLLRRYANFIRLYI